MVTLLDFVTSHGTPLLKKLLKKIKVISNAGGVNPLACRGCLAKKLLKRRSRSESGCVLGDDLCQT